MGGGRRCFAHQLRQPPLLLGLARAPAKGAAASPLDGGALTRMGSVRVGEGAGNDAMFFPFSLDRRSLLLR